jgi:hypothetical protein
MLLENKVITPVATSYAASYNGSQEGNISWGVMHGWTGVTMSAWVNVSTFLNQAGIIFARNGNGMVDINGLSAQDTATDWNFYLSNGSGYYYVVGSGGGGLNTWVHLCGVWDAGTTNMSLFVNGVLAGQAAMPGAISQLCNLRIGRDEFTYDTRKLKGKVDEICIWQRRLTSNEVWDISQSRYITTNQTFSDGVSIGQNMRVLYHCDENTGTALTDTSGNGLTGDLGTGTWGTGVNLSQGQVSAAIVNSIDGVLIAEKGIHTLGDASGRTIVEGTSTRFNAGGVEQLRLDDGALTPTTDNDVDIGSGTKRLKADYTVTRYLNYVNPTNYVTLTCDAYNYYFTMVSNGTSVIKTNSLY